MPPVDQPAPLALVTGAARRIGRAIATDLAAAGFDLAIHYRSSVDEARELAASIRAMGRRIVLIEADLARPADVAEIVPRCVAAIGPPTCLVNNASEFLPDTIGTVSDATWTRHLDINLRAPVMLAKAMQEHLPQGENGNIINIIDQRVWKLTPEFFSYTISKAGLWTATRTLAQALAPRIRVNAIGPGPVLKSVHQTENDFSAEVRSTLLQRGPSPGEIGAAVRFILASPSLTGQMIALDGGQHLTWSEHDLHAASTFGRPET
ncbi:MAG: SDR family oxidoreductase [Hyphomicrobium sp.]|nr:SDR family oxidoreductase [Hyphomicrobium sp.]